MSLQNIELNNETEKGRNPLILVGGMILLVGVFLVLIFGGSFLGSENGAEVIVQESAELTAVQLPESGPPLQVGDQPYEFSLLGVDGEMVTLSQFIGRPILINFWATWCGPCRIEMPEIQAVWTTYQDDGLVLLALDQDESAEDVQAFFDELGLTFTPLLDEGNETSRKYGLQSLPSSVFINPEGEITTIHRGIMTRGQLDTFLAEILPVELRVTE